jgi:NAD(P)-dependent dehydrogenase (short-subunit alcohol dehydrogenase family)
MDMHGMVVIITGGSAGLGLETAKALYAMGAQLVLPVRNVTKGKQAQEAIMAASPSRHVPLSVWQTTKLD